MKQFVGFCIRRPVSVSMFTLAVAIFGAVSFTRLPLNLLPEISYPTLTVETRYSGAAPAEIETLITRPIEEAVGVISGIRRLSSRSRAGHSEVSLEFVWGTPMDFAALDVREKLDLVRLPEDAKKPTLLRFDPSSDPIVRLGISGELSLANLRQYAEEELKKDLDTVDGIAAVKVEGGLTREIQVDVDESRLATYGIAIAQIRDALAAANVNMAGGSIYEEEARYLVRTLNEFRGLEDIEATEVLREEDRRVLLRDVASVHWGHKTRESIIRTDGQEAVELRLFKEGDANTVQVARRVRERMEELDELLPPGVQMNLIFDQSTFIEGAIDEVIANAWQGGLLAILIIALFLANRLATGIIALSIPISVIATFFIMHQMGLSLNIMSLGGLALGVGMLLDDSIVVLESIFRHRDAGSAPALAAVNGATEVGGAVVASTLTTIAVFLPIVFVEGVAGQLFRDQALTVSISILASLAFSLALIPVLAARIRTAGAPVADSASKVPEGGSPRPLTASIAVALRWVRSVFRAVSRAGELLFRPVLRGFSHLEDELTATYVRLCRGALRHKGAVLLAALTLFLGSVLLARNIGVELIPNMAQGEFYFDVELPEGTPLEWTDRLITDVAAEVQAMDGLALTLTSAGVIDSSGGESATAQRGENRSRLHVVMKDKQDRQAEEQTIDAIRASLRNRPGIQFQFGRPSYFSFSRPVELEVYGDRSESLEQAAAIIAESMEAIDGLTDVRSSAEIGNPELRVVFTPDRLAQMGLSVDQVSQTLRTQLRGDVATRLNEGERRIDIVVRASDRVRNRVSQVPELVVSSEDRAIPLKAVASTELDSGPAEIRRVSQRNTIIISANLAGRDLGSVTEEIESMLAKTPLPAGISTRFAGQRLEMTESFGSLFLAIGLAVFLVYFVMASKFESLLHPFIILFTIPLGLVGVIWSLAITGNPVSVIVLIGVVMLAGIVVKNAIVLVDYINQLREQGHSLDNAIVEAGRVRLRPILMTTLTTILGLVPMALGFGEGAEIRAPMAITVIGGLAVSTVLTLIVIPTVYATFQMGEMGETGKTAEANS